MGAIHSTKIPTGPTGEKWSTSKGGPVFSKLFRLDRTDPLSFGPKFSEILVEWIAPSICSIIKAGSQKERQGYLFYRYED